MQNLLLILTVCFALACSKVSSLTGDSSESTENKPKGDSERPSDVGEGVPGYLADPDQITFVRDADKLTINAPAGTVRAPGGDPRQVVLTLLRIPTENIAMSTASSVAAVTVATVSAAEDGAIEATISTSESGALVLQVGEPAADGTLTIKNVEDERIHAVYNDLAGTPTLPLDLALWAQIRESDAQSTAADDGQDGDATTEEKATLATCQADGNFWDQIAGKCVTTRTLVTLKYCWPTPDLGNLKELIGDREPPEDNADDDLESYKDDGYILDQCYKEAGDPTKIVINLFKSGTSKTILVTAAAFEAGDLQ